MVAVASYLRLNCNGWMLSTIMLKSFAKRSEPKSLVLFVRSKFSVFSASFSCWFVFYDNAGARRLLRDDPGVAKAFRQFDCQRICSPAFVASSLFASSPLGPSTRSAIVAPEKDAMSSLKAAGCKGDGGGGGRVAAGCPSTSSCLGCCCCSGQ